MSGRRMSEDEFERHLESIPGPVEIGGMNVRVMLHSINQSTQEARADHGRIFGTLVLHSVPRVRDYVVIAAGRFTVREVVWILGEHHSLVEVWVI